MGKRDTGTWGTQDLTDAIDLTEIALNKSEIIRIWTSKLWFMMSHPLSCSTH